MIDKEQLEIELLLKVVWCVEKYDSTRNAKFETFVINCLKNAIQDAIRDDRRNKRTIVTNAVSLSEPIKWDFENEYTGESDTNPYYTQLARLQSNVESENDILNRLQIEAIKEWLDPLCQEILDLLLLGCSIPEISILTNEPKRLIRGLVTEVIKPLLREEIILD